MTFWDFLLSATSVVSTFIITFIPLRYDIHNKETRKITKPGWWFIGVCIFAVVCGIGANYNLYRESLKSEQENKTQQANYSVQLKSMRISDSTELASARKAIIDSMNTNYAAQEARTKRQLQTLESSRQRTLTSVDKKRLVSRINDLMKNEQIQKDVPMVIVCPMGNEESRIYAHGIHKFLKSKGYNLTYPPEALGDGTIGTSHGAEEAGFRIIYYRHKNQILIDVATIKSRP